VNRVLIGAVATLVVMMLRLHTNTHLPERKREMEAVAFSFLLLSFVWLNALYVSLRPQTITETFTVFDAYESQGNTIILTFGHGKRSFIGEHNFTVGHTYEVTYSYPRMRFLSSSRPGIRVKLLNMRDLNATNGGP